MKRLTRLAALALPPLLWMGCVPRPLGQASPLEGRVITAEEIERIGARNAWEVLRQAHLPLSFYQSRTGQPVHLSRRGTRSFSPGSEPLVIVNGTLTEGLRLLHDIRAGDIASIRVLSGIEATYRYGTGAAGGAILIETRKGPHR